MLWLKRRSYLEFLKGVTLQPYGRAKCLEIAHDLLSILCMAGIAVFKYKKVLAWLTCNISLCLRLCGSSWIAGFKGKIVAMLGTWYIFWPKNSILFSRLKKVMINATQQYSVDDQTNSECIFIYLSKCIQTNKSGCPSNGGLLTQQQMLPVKIAYQSLLSLSI